MHKTHGRLVTLMIIQVTEVVENRKEIPVSIARLTELQKPLRHFVSRFHGDLVEVSSGEVYAYFPGARLAFKAATYLPKLMSLFSLRIGLHMGEVLFRQDKPQGLDLNLVARLPALSRAGGICLSQSVYQYLKHRDQQKLIILGSHTLKNFETQVPLYAFFPEGQRCRRKTREYQRSVMAYFRKHRKVLNLKAISILSVLILALAFGWSHFKSLPISSPDKLEVFMPEFKAEVKGDFEARLFESIEMTVKAQIASSAGKPKLLLMSYKHPDSVSVKVRLSLNAGQLNAKYHIYPPESLIVAISGEVMGDESDLFGFQNRLSSMIVYALKKHEIVADGILLDSIKITSSD